MFAACYSTISTFNAQVGVKHILFDTVYTNVVEAVAVDAQYRGGLGLVESRLEVEWFNLLDAWSKIIALLCFVW